jgi:signal transduction histidine kinase
LSQAVTDQDAIPGRGRHIRALVALDYPVRVVAHLAWSGVGVFILLERGASPALWAVLGAQSLLWPHVAYLVAGNARQSTRAEPRNLLVDAFVAGCWATAVSFGVWPAVTLVMSIIVAVLSAAGIRFSPLPVLILLAGSIVTDALAGVRFGSEASPAAAIIGVAGIVVYSSLLGFLVNRQVRTALRFRKTIEGQDLEIQQRSALLAQARESADQAGAAAEALRVVNNSPIDLQPVLDAVAQSAARVCGADDAIIHRIDGDALQAVAHHGPVPLFPPIGSTEGLPIRGSITGRAVLERRVIHIHDAAALSETQFPVARSNQPLTRQRTTLAAPLLRQGVPIGTILIRRLDVRPFSDREIELLKTFSDQAAIAIDNARLFQALQSRSHDLATSLDEVRALSDVTRAISSSLDLQQVLDTVVRHAATLSGCEAGAIFRFERDSRSFSAIASYNLEPGFLRRIAAMPVDPSTGAIQRAVETGEPFQIPDIDASRNYVFRDVTLEEGFHALLAAPIPGENITRGITVFRRAPGRFEDRIVDLLTALANQSKVAIDNARLFQKVQSQRIELERLSQNLDRLYQLSTAIQEPLSLRDQLRRVLEAASEMGILDRLHVWAVGPAGDRLVNLAGAGFSEEEWWGLEGAEIPLTEAGAMYKAYEDGQPLVFDDEHPVPPALRLRPPYSRRKALRTRSFLVIPMIARGTTVGIFAGDNKPSGRPIVPDTVRLLHTFAAHAAVAIANARLFEAMESATRAKSQFLANMSHELRTPLNAILGYTELILDRVYGEVPPKIRDVLGRVEKSGRHLLGLINDVLDLSKIEAGQSTLHLSDYSVRDVLQTVVTAVEGLAADKKLALVATVSPDLPMARGDERRLTQVLLNLVGNAIKFTEGGQVAITVAMADGGLTFSVADTGPGIALEDQRRIFDEFQQADSSNTRSKGGTGLGLAIAQRIIQMHGGRLWVESTPGAGATFHFTIPIRPSGDAGGAEPGART